MKDYAELSDDALIDLLVAKTKGVRRAQRGVESGKRRVVSQTGHKQDGDVTRSAKFADRTFRSVGSRRSPLPEPRQAFQADFLAKLDLACKHEPDFPTSDARPNAEPEVEADGAKRYLDKEIGSINELRSIALALIRNEHRQPVGMRTLRDQLRKELLAGGDPLGECYSWLRSAQARREAGITLTPLRIVDSMVTWAAAQIRSGRTAPARIVDPGSGTGRFAFAAARKFPKAHIIAIENDPELVLLLRANLQALDLSSRVTVIAADFRTIDLPPIDGPTLFVGNPPYVRHHNISRAWKEWYSRVCKRHGAPASQLAGSHLHFFAKVAEIGRNGDYGCFITAAEWLDVGYGSTLRTLLANGLGGAELHVLEPTAEAFPGTMTTAAVTGFFIGQRPESLAISRVAGPADLESLEAGSPVPWNLAAATPRWSVLVRGGPSPAEGLIELGELCRVHRGQVTGANKIWIAAAHAKGLPECVLKPTVTSAHQIIGAGPILDDERRLPRVIDLPPDLDTLSPTERAAVERFIRWAKSAGAADGYIARHRTPWWAIRLAEPAPIVCTYMGRRPPAFTRNRAGARLLNIAHGVYPRQDFSDEQLIALVAVLNTTVSKEQGRTYAGGLTKFEPRELERVLIPWSEALG